MGIQFILLVVILTIIFYKPVSKVIDDREIYINSNLKQAYDTLLKSEELYNQYENKLQDAKKNAEDIGAKAEIEAKNNVDIEIAKARSEASILIKETNKKLEDEKFSALQKLEIQIDELSQLIKDKLIGKEIVI
jgi:F-type H+-transporting ATPase subunit b